MKYQVGATVTISIHCVVEADSEAEAKEKAECADMMTLCHQCASGAGGRHGLKLDEWHTSGEFDGDAKIRDVMVYSD